MTQSPFRAAALTGLAVGVMAMALAPIAEARPGFGGGGQRAAVNRGGGQINRGGARTSINGAAGNRSGNTVGNRTGNNSGNRNNGNRAAINSGNRVVNNNVNVNVDHGWDDCCHHGWYDHPVAAGVVAGTAAAVTAAAIGSMVYSLPPACTPYNYSGYYYSCGGVWYQPRYEGTSVTYVVVKEPPH